MYWSQVTPLVATLLWLPIMCNGQYDPYGAPPYYGEPQPPIVPYFNPPEVPSPQAQPPQQFYPPFANSNNNANQFNPFLPTGQQSQNQLNQQQQQQLLLQQQQQLQQLQGSYPNLPSVPFQTVTPNNPLQRVDKYPFNPQNNLGSVNNNLNTLSNQLQQQQQQQNFGNTLLNQQQYPKLPDLPFQTITPGQVQPNIASLNNPNQYLYKPKIELPKIRVIEFPSSEYFEYGGGKLVQPKRPNSDLYVGGSGGDVPITSKVFVECTGPNQVEWLFNATNTQVRRKGSFTINNDLFMQKNLHAGFNNGLLLNQQKKDKELSVVTKNFQITIPEERAPTPGSREYTYLRLGLEEQISEQDSGVYICRDRILPQNYISIRVLVASRFNGGFSEYPISGSPSPSTYLSSHNSGVGSSNPKFGTPSLGGNIPGELVEHDNMIPFGVGVNPYGLPAPPSSMSTDDYDLLYRNDLDSSSYPQQSLYPQNSRNVDMSGVFSSTLATSSFCNYSVVFLGLLTLHLVRSYWVLF